MERRLLLDVVVGERAAILELLAGEDQALLVRRDALHVLDLGLDFLDRFGRLDLEGEGLASEGLDEHLETSATVRGPSARLGPPAEPSPKAGFAGGPRARLLLQGPLLCVAEVDQLDSAASSPQELVQLLERAPRSALVVDTQAAGEKCLG